MLKIIPNKKNIGAEIIVNLKEISNKDIFKIKRALNKYGMLYFKEQKLTSKLFIKFAKNFGNYKKRNSLMICGKSFEDEIILEFNYKFDKNNLYKKIDLKIPCSILIRMV